ncbi:MAG: hypothetical protein K9L74_04250 [Candidatus Izimaplasma sp.]|nr:hypothetical protein [Candidatus Izimaplasma bacterium]
MKKLQDKKLYEAIKKQVEELGYDLYEIHFDKQGNDDFLSVRIYGDSPVTLDDTVIVSKALNPLLDDLDPFDHPYMLEVTSAGAERELRTVEEIKKAINKDVFIKTLDQHFTGKLLSFNESRFKLKLKNQKEVDVNDIDVQEIHLVISL